MTADCRVQLSGATAKCRLQSADRLNNNITLRKAAIDSCPQ